MSDLCTYCRQDLKARDHADCEAWSADVAEIRTMIRAADVPDRDRLADAAMHTLGCATPDQRVRIVTALIDAWKATERAR